MAHDIVSRVVKEAVRLGRPAGQLTPELLNDAARETIGRPLALTEEELRRSLSPQHFVNVRKLPGGPSPDEVRRALAGQRQRQERDEAWLKAKRDAIERARRQVNHTIAEWAERCSSRPDLPIH